MRTADAAPISNAELSSLFHDLECASALVLAVSGGPDSTALMVLAARWREMLKTPPKLIAITIDHGLRKEAKREAAQVAKLARKLKITHRTLRWIGKKPKTGIQRAAREARYRLLAHAARRVGATHILTGHTRDDQAETVLIRMARGSGLTGLGAMQRMTVLPYSSPERKGLIAPTGPREVQPDDRLRAIGAGSILNEMTPIRPPLPSTSAVDPPLTGRGMEARGEGSAVLLVRPMLDTPKSRLIATLKAAKIPFAEDPSNRDPRFARARLRLLMTHLAAEGLTSERLTLLARRLKRADVALKAAVDRAAAEFLMQSTKAHTIIVNTTDFTRLPAEIALRLLGQVIAQTGDEGPVELAKLEVLTEELAMAQKSGKRRFRRTLAGACITLTQSFILVERAPPRRRKTLRNSKVLRKRLLRRVTPMKSH